MSELETVQTDEAPAAIGPYSQAIVSGDLVFTSGQIGLVPGDGVLVDGVAAQAEQCMSNLEAVLASAGTSFDRVVKVTIYLADLGDFGTVNEIYARRLGDARPARATVEVSRLPMDARVEIDCIARR